MSHSPCHSTLVKLHWPTVSKTPKFSDTFIISLNTPYHTSSLNCAALYSNILYYSYILSSWIQVCSWNSFVCCSAVLSHMTIPGNIDFFFLSNGIDYNSYFKSAGRIQPLDKYFKTKFELHFPAALLSLERLYNRITSNATNFNTYRGFTLVWFQ